MSKYASGRVLKIPPSSLTQDRYSYLSLSQAEPNLGDPLAKYDYPGTLPVGLPYQMVAVPGYPGERYWIPISGGIIPGSVSVYNQNRLVGTSNSITQLNFVGVAVSASATPLGVAATISIFAPGSNGQVIFNNSGDFGAASGIYYNSVNSYVGIGTTNPIDNLDIVGNLNLRSSLRDFYGNVGAGGSILISTGAGVSWVTKSAAGIQGLQGLQGNQGLSNQGLQGTQGTQGLQGLQGLQGNQGLSNQGLQGTQGTQGLQGLQGNQGLSNQGLQGTQGTQGLQGLQGLQGTQGRSNQGLQGQQGIQGAQGQQGAQGLSGQNAGQGTQGTQGLQAEKGSQGIQGQTSGQGSQGTQGLQGFTGGTGGSGSQGAQGLQGVQGTQGVQGFTGGSGGTGGQGTQGTTGNTGGAGSQGTIGSSGGAGSQGTQGVQGFTGGSGGTGGQGTQGTTGNTGGAGSQGTIGSSGGAGSQGTQGVQGFTGGSGGTGGQGTQGTQGTQGVQSTQGTVGFQGVQGTTGSDPPGTIITVAASTAPTGYLKANGASLSTTTYASLFAAIGYTFGGSGASFTLPDLRGEFIRGWDDARGADSGRSFGSFQADDFKSHLHTVSGYANVTTSGGFPVIGVGAFGSFVTANTSSSGGTETRPRNIALLHCIKY